MLPKLKFRVSYKKDVSTFFCFVAEAHLSEGQFLNWAIFNRYPHFKKYIKNKVVVANRKTVETFVKKAYFKNQSVIKRNILIHQQNWKKLEKIFYLLVNQLFPNQNWPKGKYIAYPTIWGMYPRFLENKTFQIPYSYKSKKYVSVIIAHEMLHFIFYDYFIKYYPKYKKDKNGFFVWHISEIFNAVIQNSPSWLREFQLKSIIYPEHKAVIQELQKKYYKSSSFMAEDLIEDIIKKVKTKIV